ncbi:MAG: diaminopimelate decarboxylase [Candidatus Acidiferrales bacterium]
MNSKRGRKKKRSRGVDPAAYTPHYRYRFIGGRPRDTRHLHCEDVPLERIAGEVGTPAYVYSQTSIEDAYRNMDRALGSLPHLLCYAVKANSNLSILRILTRLGSGFDIVSGGELDRLRRIGVSGQRIVFSGVGKSRDEIRDALDYGGGNTTRHGLLLFNIESTAELEVLLEEASRHSASRRFRPSVSIRVNPDVLAGGHRNISTGYRNHKFGVDWQEARRLYLAHKDSRRIEWRGISAHIGSQIVSLAPFRLALARIVRYVRELAQNGVHLDRIDFGGGLGIRYTNETPPGPDAYARVLKEIVRSTGCRLLLEPGRTIVGPAGVLITKVLYRKENRVKTFVIVDAGMNDLIRPVLYDATHPITPIARGAAASAAKSPVDIVGPVCETGDYLARGWPLEEVKAGDLLAVWAAGAYGFVESSNFNARRRAAEVLVRGSKYKIVRRRETYDDLVRCEL